MALIEVNAMRQPSDVTISSDSVAGRNRCVESGADNVNGEEKYRTMSSTLNYKQASPEAAPSRGTAASGIEPSVAAGRARLESIDLLRGLVMVLMALDHTRDFFAAGNFDVRDVHDTALFLTRWITHFCAPAFVFLAGTSAFLYGARGRTVREVSRFLFTRGLWMVLLEVTIVRFAWTFSVLPGVVFLQVIWAIGVSMIVLAGLAHLPRWAVGAVGVGMILFHNALDGIQAEHFGPFGWLWDILHQPAMLHPASDVTVIVHYPLIPWIGVMAAGFAVGPVMLHDPAHRRRWLVASGIVVTLGFVLLRATNLYGDPAPWAPQDTAIATVLSFVNTEKYPPSALYLAMTLGPMLVALAAFETAHGKLARVFITFGHVALFYYVAHLLLLHTLAAAYGAALGDETWLFGGLPMTFGGLPVGEAKPGSYGLGLPGVYGVWVLVVVALYPLCRLYADVKRRRKDLWWLSYL